MDRRNALLGLAASPLVFSATRAAASTRADRIRWQGEELRLSDILAPSRAASPGAAQEDLFAEGALARIENVGPPDRWGRRVVRIWLTVPHGLLSLQESLIARGLARVAPESADDEFIDLLFKREQCARKRRLGIWAKPSFHPLNHAEAGKAIGEFALVEGRVLRAARSGSRIYLNFGENYRTDFTCGAPAGDARKWRAEGLDLLALEGSLLRMRGYIERINGPMMALRHRRQIEFLENRSETDLEAACKV